MQRVGHLQVPRQLAEALPCEGGPSGIPSACNALHLWESEQPFPRLVCRLWQSGQAGAGPERPLCLDFGVPVLGAQ
eukprot:8580357-Lingulodinium_polyedra.AAC.1